MQERKYYNAKSFKDVAQLYYLQNGTKQVETITQTQHAWYFSILKTEAHKHIAMIKSLKEYGIISNIVKDKNYYKIYCHKVMYSQDCNSEEVIREFKKHQIQMFESDLKIHDRVFIDRQLSCADEHVIAHWDIETDDRNTGVVPGRDRILSMALYFRNGEVHYFTNESERLLLEEAMKVLKTCTIITGWNSAGENKDGFDMPALKERCNVNNVKFELWDVNHVDLLVWFKKALKAGMLEERPKNFKLGTVCEQFLNMNKTEGVKAGGGNIWDLYVNNPKLLKKYNVQDVTLLNSLDLKLGIIDQCIRQSVITKSFVGGLNIWQGICTPSELVDKFVLNMAYRYGRKMPSKDHNAKKPIVKRFIKKKKTKKVKDD